MAPAPAPGDVAVLRRPFSIARAGLGYLEALAGERVEVLAVGRPCTDDAGWLFVRRCEEPAAPGCDQEGWLPAFLVEVPPSQPAPEVGRSSGVDTRPRPASAAEARPRATLGVVPDVCDVLGDGAVASDSVAAVRSGYLTVEKGEPLRVLHYGSARSSDEGWLYVARAAALEEQGWLLRSAVEARAVVGDAEGEALQQAPRLMGLGGWPQHAPPPPAAAAPPQAAPAPPSRCRRRVELATFGLELCDEELTASYDKDSGGGASVQIEETELLAALERRTSLRFDLVVDARRFPDPDAMVLTRHTGVHHAIIARLVRHRNFPRWLGDVKRRLLALAIGRSSGLRGAGAGAFVDSAPLRVAIYCKAGKHRSVAGAMILWYVLEQDGWDCVEPTHLSRARWGSFCCKGLCQGCRCPPAELWEETLAEALQVWCDSRDQ